MLNPKNNFFGKIIEESLSDRKILERLTLLKTVKIPVTKKNNTPWIAIYGVLFFFVTGILTVFNKVSLSRIFLSDRLSYNNFPKKIIFGFCHMD